LGVTATPTRLDGKPLGPWFGEEPLYEYRLENAIRDRILVPLRQRLIQTETDLDGVQARKGGDFATAALSRVVATEARNRVVVEAYLHPAPGRQTIIFAVDLGHVEQLRRAFLLAEVPTAAVTGKMPRDERRKVLEEFRAGQHRVLVSCELLTEGYD